MSDTRAIENMIKNQAWELAKGQLRACVAIQGSYPSGRTETMQRYETLEKEVEDFIKHIEDNGMQE